MDKELVNKLYNDKFFSEFTNIPGRREDYSRIIDLTLSFQKTTDVIDFGCGYGLMLELLNEKGINVIGVEYSDYGVKYAKDFIKEKIHILDVTKEINLKRVELVISIEVAEHLKEKDANMFIKNICDHSLDSLLFSAAEPGSDGTGHFNCQPYDYWIDKIQQNYFNLDEKKTTSLRNLYLPTCPWLNSTLGYFIRR